MVVSWTSSDDSKSRSWNPVYVLKYQLFVFWILKSNWWSGSKYHHRKQISISFRTFWERELTQNCVHVVNWFTRRQQRKENTERTKNRSIRSFLWKLQEEAAFRRWDYAESVLGYTVLQIPQKGSKSIFRSLTTLAMTMMNQDESYYCQNIYV